jgi:hypothetical protein
MWSFLPITLSCFIDKRPFSECSAFAGRRKEGVSEAIPLFHQPCLSYFSYQICVFTAANAVFWRRNDLFDSFSSHDKRITDVIIV